MYSCRLIDIVQSYVVSSVSLYARNLAGTPLAHLPGFRPGPASTRNDWQLLVFFAVLIRACMPKENTVTRASMPQP